MHIYVDADACPVLEEIFSMAKQFNIQVILIKSYAHFSHDPLPKFVQTVYVDLGKEVADFALIQRAKAGDIVITHDYGLASICLGKKCIVLHPKGFVYTNHNIDRLLHQRHEQAALRRSGQKTKGPRAYTKQDKRTFRQCLQQAIEKNLQQ